MFDDTELPRSRRAGRDAGFDTDEPEQDPAPPPRFGRLALCVAAASALAFGVVGTVAYGVWFNHDQQAYAEAMAGARRALGVPASAASAAVLAKSASSLGPPMSMTMAGPAMPSAPVAAAPVNVPLTAPMGAAVMDTAVTGPATPGAATPDSKPATNPPATKPPATKTPASPVATLTSEGEEGRKQAVWSGRVMRRPATTIAQAGASNATSAPAATSVRSSRRASSGSDPIVQPFAAARPVKDARAAQQERRATPVNAKPKGNVFTRMSLFFKRTSYRQHGRASQQDIYSHP